MAVDSKDEYYTQALDGALYKVNPENGNLTLVCNTGVMGVLDLAYKIDSDEIWAVDGTEVYIIDHKNNCRVKTFNQVRPMLQLRYNDSFCISLTSFHATRTLLLDSLRSVS